MDRNQTIPTPEQRLTAPEAGSKQASLDRLEAKTAPVPAEAAQGSPKADDGAAVAQAQVASIATDDQAVASAQASVQATPLTAADVDVIEPEWVKKAEEAVAKNRQDPRAQESAVEAVQVDYLKQRYNLDVKSGDEKP